MNLAPLVLVAGLAIGDLDAEFVSAFEPLEFSPSAGALQDQTFRYRLFVPETKQGRLYPLIVWLHGYGDCGENNIGQLRWLDQLIFETPVDRARHPFFLLAIQCPCKLDLWYRHAVPRSDAIDDMLAVNAAILEQTIARRPIDTNRVYVAGVSAGGSAAWAFAMRYPERFAAAVPLASSGGPGSELSRIVGIPVWAFHSQSDPWLSSDGVMGSVAQLQRIGGKAHLTQIKSANHDCWTIAFRDYPVLDWLLAQRKGAKPSWEPGYEPMKYRLQKQLHGWAWWQIPIQLAVVIAPLLLARYAYVRLVRK